MIYKISLLILFIFLFTPLAYCQSPDQVTITTYYPAPYGEYQQLRLTPAAVASGSACNNNGAMTYSSTANALLVCSAGIWQPAGGAGAQFWDGNLNGNIYSRNTGNVGIGTTGPTQKLDVNGNIRVNGSVRTVQANQGIIFHGGGERIVGTSDWGIAFQTSNGAERMKIWNDGGVGMNRHLWTGAHVDTTDVWLRNAGKWASQLGECSWSYVEDYAEPREYTCTSDGCRITRWNITRLTHCFPK